MLAHPHLAVLVPKGRDMDDSVHGLKGAEITPDEIITSLLHGESLTQVPDRLLKIGCVLFLESESEISSLLQGFDEIGFGIIEPWFDLDGMERSRDGKLMECQPSRLHEES